MRVRRYAAVAILPLAALFAAHLAGAPETAHNDFVAAAFNGREPRQGTMWLTREMQQAARGILGHPYRALRVRFWFEARRSAWILDEVGKELPITVGVVVEEGRIEALRVLAFRESRGGEVRHPFFTRQFSGAGLNGNLVLDHAIDGITGATLSVRAVTAVARLALMFDDERLANGTTDVAVED